MDQRSQGEQPSAEAPEGVSRRSLITSVGKTAMIGAALSAGVVLPAAACADDDDRDEKLVAGGSSGTPAFEFVGQILQNGESFQGLGFVTGVPGLDAEWLFADPAHVTEHSEESARLTIYGEVMLQSRTVRANVFVLDGLGELEVHLNESPGADFAYPDTFRDGPVVARYSMRLRDVLTVIAPNEGIPLLQGELSQVAAAEFETNVGTRRFGTEGMRLALEGTGHGVRSQEEPPIATINLAAQLTVV